MLLYRTIIDSNMTNTKLKHHRDGHQLINLDAYDPNHLLDALIEKLALKN